MASTNTNLVQEGISSTLLAHRDFMSNVDLVLASQSPRRREIFSLMGLEDCFRVVVSNFEENLDKSSFKDPRDYAVANAVGKAQEVMHRISSGERKEPEGLGLGLGGGKNGNGDPLVVVGSDTIVELEGRILEKPRDEGEAFRMLSALSGSEHLVHSGVAIFTGFVGSQEAAASFCESTTVSFTKLSEEEIWAYIRTGEPMDKAGAYGIQGIGGQFVSKVDGCFFSVMGFPMHAFSSSLAKVIQEKRV
ncbi:unnamed protein product [Choristocarpus tenellus]